MADQKKVAQRVQEMVRPGTTSGNERARALACSGGDVLNLSGVPPWGPPSELVTEALAKAARVTSVAPSAGLLALREAIAHSLWVDNNISVDVDQVLVTNGAKEAVQIALHCVGDPGDEVIIPTPSYPYDGNVTLANLRPVHVHSGVEEGFRLHREMLEAAVSSRTCAILLNNPVNPTGRVFSEEELTWLSRLAVKHDLWMIVDESFEKLVYQPSRHVMLATVDGMRDRTITLHTFSKAHGMGPWRMGYMVGSTKLIEQALKIHEWLVLSVNPGSQLIAQAVLEGPRDWIQEYLRRFSEARDVTVAALQGLQGVRFITPEAGGNVFLDVSSIAQNTGGLAAYMLTKHGLPVLPGDVFGDTSSIRFAFGGSVNVVHEAVERLKRSIADYSAVELGQSH